MTTVGGGYGGKQPILTVVPNDSPWMEAQVLNRDVGQIQVGQRHHQQAVETLISRAMAISRARCSGWGPTP